MRENGKTSVLLANDEAELIIEGDLQVFPCAIALETVPCPRLVFELNAPNPWVGLSLARQFPVHVLNANVRCEALFTRSNDGTIVVSPTREPLSVGSSNCLQELHFDLINFPTFIAFDDSSSRHISGVLVITIEEWVITIAPSRKSPDVEAFRSALYSVTHSCALRKNDQPSFSSRIENRRYLGNFLDCHGRRWKWNYFPMQNDPKISVRISSAVVAPEISSSACSPL